MSVSNPPDTSSAELSLDICSSDLDKNTLEKKDTRKLGYVRKLQRPNSESQAYTVDANREGASYAIRVVQLPLDMAPPHQSA
jgi:hypothetical protein